MNFKITEIIIHSCFELYVSDIHVPGRYVYIEASDREPGEKAILSSEEIVGGQPVCISFWYHMHGSNIGALNIYYKTNDSQVLVWQRTGDVSKLWLFGQTSFNTTETFKVSKIPRETHDFFGHKIFFLTSVDAFQA